MYVMVIIYDYIKYNNVVYVIILSATSKKTGIYMHKLLKKKSDVLNFFLI